MVYISRLNKYKIYINFSLIKKYIFLFFLFLNKENILLPTCFVNRKFKTFTYVDLTLSWLILLQAEKKNTDSANIE